MKNLLVRLRSKNERGAALITALLFLVLLTVLGVAVVMTSNTDMFISRNDAVAKKAVYVADAGAQQAMDALNTLPGTVTIPAPTDTTSTTNATNWHYDIQKTDIHLPNNGGTEGSYTATISYKIANLSTDPAHAYHGSGTPASPVVMYNTDYGYTSSRNGSGQGGPVYTITATATIPGGGTATVVADVAKYAYNTIPPGGIYTPTLIMGGGPRIFSVNTTAGKPNDNASHQLPVYSSPNGKWIPRGNGEGEEGNGGPLVVGTQNYGPNASFHNMTGANAYLGDLTALQQIAKYSYVYDSTSGTWNTNGPLTTLKDGKGAMPTGPWGSGTYDPNTGKYSGTPIVVYIDATQLKDSTLKLTADNALANSYCLLVVKGNLDISGNTGMGGLIYVTGDLTMHGTGNGDDDNGGGKKDDDDEGGGSGTQWYGGIMAGGTTTITGNTSFSYNYDALNGLQNYFRFRVLDWQRQYQ